MKRVVIHSDGGCSPNPGEGGWAAILKFDQMEKQLYGYEAQSTNSRMELTAAIKALEALNQPCEVEFWSDSQYVINGMSQWVQGWIDRNWRTAQKKAVENRDLWERLLNASRRHQIVWNWNRGHSGNPLNERVDSLVWKARASKGL